MTWLQEKLNIKTMEDWYKVSQEVNFTKIKLKKKITKN